MLRYKKTKRRVAMETKTKDLAVESETTAQTRTYDYYSRELKQVFSSLEELKKAESKLHEEQEAKEKLQIEKKTRAKEVEEAYLEYQKVKEECYNKMIEAEKKWLELRDKFAKDYNGYHMTYVNNNGKKEVSFSDLLDKFFIW